MAVDLSGFYQIVNKPREVDLSGFDQIVNKPREIDLSGFDLAVGREPEGPGAIDYAGAFATDIGISELGRLGSATAGAALGAKYGTFLGPKGIALGAAGGFILGGLGFGAAGSIARQRILNPDGEISKGQVFADALINLIPGAKAGKFGFSAVARQARIGAGISGGANIAETVIDEDDLPTFEELAKAGLTGAALGAGLGISGEAFSKAYSKFAGLPSRKLTEAFKIGDPDAKLLINGVEKTGEEYAKMLPKTFNDIKLGISESYSDELIRARVLQNEVASGQIKDAGPLKVKSDDSDFYLQRRLSSQKITEKGEEAMRLVDLDGDFLRLKAEELGTESELLSRSVNQYLYAKHGVAYNKANRARYKKDGAAGESTKDFKNIIDDFESQGLDNQLKESIELRRDLSKRILNTLQDGGLISKVEADKLRKRFPDYVPLNRIMETDDLDDVVSSVSNRGGRYETKSPGIYRAKGSPLEVDDIYKNIFDNLINATQRAEVNKTNQAFVKLLRDNPEEAKNIAKIVKGRKSKEKEDKVLTVFENGKPLQIELTDPRLAAALKGNNKQEVEGLLKLALKSNRLLGGLYTRMNPDFLIPNLFRDRSEAFVNSIKNMKFGGALKLLNPFSVVNEDMRTIQRNLLGNKAEPGTKQAELDDIYEEFVKAGGRTGGVGLSTVKDINESIKELSGKLNQPAKSKAKTFNKFVNGDNEVFENASRFAVYRNNRANGMTPDQAAFAARNSSFDPNLQGAEGDAIRALYLFSNPAIQGAKNFLRSMNPKKNPKTFTSVMAALGGVNYTIDKWNSLTDENWRDKVGKWKTDKHISIVTGKKPNGDLNYVSIPIGYSMVPYKITADYAQRIMFSEEENIDVSEVAKDLRSSVLDAYNPMGGSPVPTVFRPILELQRNKDGIGQDIRPDWLEKQNVSVVERINPWTADTQGGELAMNLSEQLEDMGYEVSPGALLYLYQTYTGGPGKFVQRLFDVTSKLWNGGKASPNDIPVLRRFYGETYTKAFENRTGERQILENIQKQENTTRARVFRTSFKYQKRLQNAKSELERERIGQDMLNDPEVDAAVFRKIETFLEDERDGITPQDKQVRSKLKTNASKAQYYIERIKNMDREEAARYIQGQIDRGLLTKNVEELILGMQSFQSIFGN